MHQQAGLAYCLDCQAGLAYCMPAPGSALPPRAALRAPLFAWDLFARQQPAAAEGCAVCSPVCLGLVCIPAASVRRWRAGPDCPGDLGCCVADEPKQSMKLFSIPTKFEKLCQEHCPTPTLQMIDDKLTVSELMTTSLIALPPVVPVRRLVDTLRMCSHQVGAVGTFVSCQQAQRALAGMVVVGGGGALGGDSVQSGHGCGATAAGCCRRVGALQQCYTAWPACLRGANISGTMPACSACSARPACSLACRRFRSPRKWIRH